MKIPLKPNCKRSIQPVVTFVINDQNYKHQK
jgi:hypothetical protein